MDAVVLYTCPGRKHGAEGPVVKHPCGIAAKALDDAGHEYGNAVQGSGRIADWATANPVG